MKLKNIEPLQTIEHYSDSVQHYGTNGIKRHREKHEDRSSQQTEYVGYGSLVRASFAGETLRS